MTDKLQMGYFFIINQFKQQSSILPGVGKTFVNAILRNTITPLNDLQNSHFQHLTTTIPTFYGFYCGLY